MLAPLFFLAHSFSPARIDLVDVIPFAADVSAVISVEEPLPFAGLDELARRVATGRLLIVWGIYEAGGRENALGDGGKSCGVLQENPYYAGVTCTALRSDRRLALAKGLELMRFAAAQCGSVAGGLRAYAGGTCTARAALVALRCSRAGVSC